MNCIPVLCSYFVAMAAISISQTINADKLRLDIFLPPLR